MLIFPVYVLGYLGLSFSWVLIALCGLFWIRRHRGGKSSRLGRALAFLEDEEEAVRLSVSSADLPAWVSGQHPSLLPRAPAPGGLGPVTSPGPARHQPRRGPPRPGTQGCATGRSPGAPEPAWRPGWGHCISRAPLLLVPVRQPLPRRCSGGSGRAARPFPAVLPSPGWPVRVFAARSAALTAVTA